MIGRSWNLVGNSWAVEMLRQHVAQGAVRHAYLLTGQRGIGRRTLAMRFAQALNCESPQAPGLPCGKCNQCSRLERDIENLRLSPGEQRLNGHPDLRIIEPVPAAYRRERELSSGTGESRSNEGSSSRNALAIRIEQIRDEREKITLRPYMARYRVLVFVRFEEATTEAANALLKTLEEAPAHAVIIITAENAEDLLPTIVSRCEVLRLQPVRLPEVQAFLEGRGASEAQARLLTHVCGGRPGAVLRLLEDADALAERESKLAEMMALLSANRTERFGYAERLVREKQDVRAILLLWLSFWRDVMLRAATEAVPISNIDREKEVDSTAGRMGLPGARQIVHDLDLALRRYESNVNARLLLETVLLGWPR